MFIRIGSGPDINLNSKQHAAITELYMLASQRQFDQHRDAVVSALHIIAGLIGRQYKR